MILKIVPYDKERDGEEAGILWADGLIESLIPLYFETILYAPVVQVLVGAELVIVFMGFSSFWVKILPIIFFFSVSILIGLLGVALKIHTRWTRATRIDKAFTSSSNPRSGDNKTILGQWVLRNVSHPASNVYGGSPNVLGCISLYREESHNIKNAPNDPAKHNRSDDVDGTVWISHATIDPRFRRKGWGNRLATHAESEARKVGAKKIRIVSGNAQTQPFWQSRGYKLLSTRWTLLAHESVYMELDLLNEQKLQ